MILLTSTRQLLSNAIYRNSRHANLNFLMRNLMSKQLVYCEFGDPLEVVKCRESIVPPLGKTDVLVRMLAAPVNPADINTIQGTSHRSINLGHVFNFADTFRHKIIIYLCDCCLLALRFCFC